MYTGSAAVLLNFGSTVLRYVQVKALVWVRCGLLRLKKSFGVSFQLRMFQSAVGVLSLAWKRRVFSFIRSVEEGRLYEGALAFTPEGGMFLLRGENRFMGKYT